MEPPSNSRKAKWHRALPFDDQSGGDGGPSPGKAVAVWSKPDERLVDQPTGGCRSPCEQRPGDPLRDPNGRGPIGHSDEESAALAQGLGQSGQQGRNIGNIFYGGDRQNQIERRTERTDTSIIASRPEE